jgi:hypothetical protein
MGLLGKSHLWAEGYMHFKLAGLLFLLIGGYFAVDAIIVTERQHSEVLSAQVYPLVAIFLAMTVRVLQAEKHHRKEEREPEQKSATSAEEEVFSRN